MVPIGGIIQWAGLLVDIPEYWQLCDGSNGTPDLRNRFMLGVGLQVEMNGTGGSSTHTHPFTGDGHYHSQGQGVSCQGAGPGEAWETVLPSSTTQAAGTTDDGDNTPPYYALAYIQRMA